jgi:excisionase family DNA binding protein
VNTQREWRLLHWRAMASLRPAEVAAVTGLSQRTVSRLIDSGQIRAERPVEGCVLVPVPEVRRLIGDERGDTEAPAARTLADRAREVVSRLDGGGR